MGEGSFAPPHLRFEALVAQRLGLETRELRPPVLETALTARLDARAMTAESYFAEFEAARGYDDELGALAPLLTVGETYFFRDAGQMEAFAQLLGSARHGSRVLSAGCASGEEPYSLAMLALEQPAQAGGVRIDALDVNPTALSSARRGSYSAWSLRETPQQVRERWFTQVGSRFLLDEEVKRCVSFHAANLFDCDFEQLGRGVYDVVFCRNVLMYFKSDAARDIVKRLHAVLADGGYLFLGHAETLRNLSDGFELCQHRGAFYYRRKSQPSIRRTSAAQIQAEDTKPHVGDGTAPADSKWFDVIANSTARVEALARSHFDRHAEGLVRPLHDAVELLREERFGDALAAVKGAAEALDVDALLFQAALFTQNGQFAEAEAACDKLLGFDDLHAGAHYVRGLCREGNGDAEAALAEHRVAAYLDSKFAMPHLHLGLLLHKRGEHSEARRELEIAESLLREESSERVVLFGGGFGRSALLDLCRAQLAACQGVADGRHRRPR